MSTAEERQVDGPGVCAGVALGALLREARARREAFVRGHASLSAELFLRAARRLSLELEGGSGAFTQGQGESLSVVARVWEGERSGLAVLPLGGPEDLEDRTPRRRGM